jgi:hypothetical protein
MTTTVEPENSDSRVDVTSGDMSTALTDSLVPMQSFSGAKRMSSEEQRRFFRNTKNFFE